MKARVWGAVAGVLWAGVVSAQDIRVVADIAPVHSIVAGVMKGVGTPELIVRPEESPHDFDMRPSTARALQDATVVFWMGEGIAAKLEKPLETIAGQATVVNLAEVEGAVRFDFREVAVFEADEHHDDHGDHDEHDDHHDHEDGHDDHEAHGDDHDDHHDEEGHAEGHDDHDDHHHDHDGLDPHMWLDPENAKVWAAHIASALSAADPSNAATYKANADQMIQDIEAAAQEIEATLAPVADHGFVVFHDAYQYFEKRFGLNAAGALLESDASSPSAARLAEIQDIIEDKNITCVFVEPQFNPRVVQAVAAKAKTGEMDPLGVAYTPGPDLYLNVLRSLSANMAVCLRD